MATAPAFPAPKVHRMTQNQFSGLLGAALLFGGIFSPIFSSPLKGSIGYFQYDRVEASIMLGLAALALAFALARRYRALMLVGVGTVGMLAFALIKFQIFTSGSDARWLRKFSDSEFEGINRLVRETFALEWGWGPLLVGAVLLLAAGRFKGYSR